MSQPISVTGLDADVLALAERVNAHAVALEGLREAVQYLLTLDRARRGPKVIDDEGNVVPGAPLPETFTLPPLPSSARSSSEVPTPFVRAQELMAALAAQRHPRTGDDPQSPDEFAHIDRTDSQ